MDRQVTDLTTDAELDAALERTMDFSGFPRIIEAVYRTEPELRFRMLRLSDGHRLLIPREMLGELSEASEEEAAALEVGPEGLDIWWPQLNDGLYPPDFWNTVGASSSPARLHDHLWTAKPGREARIAWSHARLP